MQFEYKKILSDCVDSVACKISAATECVTCVTFCNSVPFKQDKMQPAYVDER